MAEFELAIFLSNPVPPPDLHFDSLSYPVASVAWLLSLFPSPQLLSYQHVKSRGSLEKEQDKGAKNKIINFRFPLPVLQQVNLLNNLW